VVNIAVTVGTEALAGLERVMFRNPDNGFCVLWIKPRGQRELITAAGHAATDAAGEFVQMNSAGRMTASTVKSSARPSPRPRRRRP
jgi:hypothetical protein